MEDFTQMVDGDRSRGFGTQLKKGGIVSYPNISDDNWQFGLGVLE